MMSSLITDPHQLTKVFNLISNKKEPYVLDFTWQWDISLNLHYFKGFISKSTFVRSFYRTETVSSPFCWGDFFPKNFPKGGGAKVFANYTQGPIIFFLGVSLKFLGGTDLGGNYEKHLKKAPIYMFNLFSFPQIFSTTVRQVYPPSV